VGQRFYFWEIACAATLDRKKMGFSDKNLSDIDLVLKLWTKTQ